MELGIQEKEKQQLMAKINEYKIRPKNFAPEEVQFMQLKAMEMGIPFSADVKTSTGHKISVAGGEFLDKLLFDLIPDNAKEAIFGRPMNESERKWASAAGTIGFLGGFLTPGAPAKLLMKGLRPKMVAMLGKNPGMLRSARNSMKAMGFKNPQILRDAVKTGRKGEGGAYSKFMSKGGTKGKTKKEVSTPAEMEEQAAKLSPTAQRGAKNSYVNPAEVGQVFNARMLNNPEFQQAVAGARTRGEWKKLALAFFNRKGYGKTSAGNAAIKNFLNKYAANPYSSDDLLRAANNLGGPSNAVRQFVKKGTMGGPSRNMNTPMPPNMNVGRYNRTPGGGLEQVPMGGTPPAGASRVNPNMRVMPDGQIIMGGQPPVPVNQAPQFGGLLGGGPRLNPPQPQLGYSPGPMTLF